MRFCSCRTASRAWTALALACQATTAAAAISYSGGMYTQDFDSLPSGGTNPLSWANNSTLPGWHLYRQGETPTEITAFNFSTGSSTAGSFYSFGATENTDRALGAIASGGAYFGNPSSGAVAGWMAVAFTNDTQSTVTSFTVGYAGEQWRNGGDQNSTTPPDALPQTTVMEYGFGLSFEAVEEWIAAGSAFDFTSPVVAQMAAAVDGNVEGRVGDLGGTIAVQWPAGDNLWIRWVDINDPNNDHGLAIDDFVFSTGEVTPPTNNADFDNDGDVDGADFLTWQRGFGLTGQIGKGTGDATGDGNVDGGDLAEWTGRFGGPPSGAAAGQIPEPSSAWLTAGLLAASGFVRRRNSPNCD